MIKTVENKRIPKSQNGEDKLNAEDEFTDAKLLLARSLRFYRKSAGLTQKQLSINSGVSESEIKQIETRQKNVTLETIVKLAVAMDQFYINLYKKDVTMKKLKEGKINPKELQEIVRKNI
jgi:transcriptional regulator with XRE-family HTH domain